MKQKSSKELFEACVGAYNTIIELEKSKLAPKTIYDGKQVALIVFLHNLAKLNLVINFLPVQDISVVEDMHQALTTTFGLER